ncbi:M23 family metallopeptidase [Prevotella fusca]
MDYITIAAEGFIGTPRLKETPHVDFGDPLSHMQIRRNRASNLFGKVRNNNTKNHQGFDYYALEGTEVYAVANGEVVCIVDPPLGDYGKQIIIKIDNSNYYAFYAHLSQIYVKKRDPVEKGDTIGKTGITGNAKTFRGLDQHLHFECRTAAILGKGLDGRVSPNNIVLTKFYSQDPKSKMQSSLGVYKVDKNNKKTKMDCIL